MTALWAQHQALSGTGTNEIGFGGSPPLVSIAMIGPRMHFAVPIILASEGFLDTFFTDVYFGNKPWLYRLMNTIPKDTKPGFIRQLCARSAARIPPERVVSFDLLGFWYLLKRRRRMSYAELTELFAEMNRLFGDSVVRRGLGDSDTVWGFNGASLEIFKHAREKGISCILEQTIAPRRIERELLLQEVSRWPEWQPGLDSDLKARIDPLAEREEAEWKLADKIVCGSDFVLDGLRSLGVPPRICSVVPYGVETNGFQLANKVAAKKTLNVLFMGEIGLRKGVPYLLEALRALNLPERVHAKLVGRVVLDRGCLARYGTWCNVVGPVPRHQVNELYRWADLLVLPSICEGSATVTYEAMTRGLPVITTSNSGSLIRDQIEGFIVPVSDAQALRDRIEMLCEDTELRVRLVDASRERAKEASLEAYRKRLLEVFTLGRN